mgnify:CR=1 FL=1
MLRRLFVSLPFGTLAACAQPAKSGPATAESIMDRYVEVTGGKAARDKVVSQSVVGRVEIPSQGIKGVLTIYRKKGASYMSMDIPGVGKMENGHSGHVAWERSAMMGPRLKEGDEQAQSLREAALDIESNWRNYFTATLAGEEQAAGEACYKLILTPKTGAKETRFYSKASGLLVKASAIQKSPMGEIPVDTMPSDYREVDGVKMPFKLTVVVGPQQMSMIQETVVNNAPIPADKLALPADIKALTSSAPK